MLEGIGKIEVPRITTLACSSLKRASTSDLTQVQFIRCLVGVLMMLDQARRGLVSEIITRACAKLDEYYETNPRGGSLGSI
jgi:hypothetical protein